MAQSRFNHAASVLAASTMLTASAHASIVTFDELLTTDAFPLLGTSLTSGGVTFDAGAENPDVEFFTVGTSASQFPGSATLGYEFGNSVFTITFPEVSDVNSVDLTRAFVNNGTSSITFTDITPGGSGASQTFSGIQGWTNHSFSSDFDAVTQLSVLTPVNGFDGVLLDNLNFTAVPESSSLVLLTVGGTALLGGRRREEKLDVANDTAPVPHV